MAVVLVGFMGAGKTTVGHILAERLGQPFVDTDVLIEQRIGRSIREVFATEGEAYFRELEHATVAELVRGRDAVVSLGGGAVQDPRTRAVLRQARVVYLRVSYAEALARVQGDEYRPMLARPGLDVLYARRLPFYEDLSAVTIDTDGRRPDAVAHEALTGLTALPAVAPGGSSVLVTPVGGSYYAHIGPGLTGQADTLLPPLPGARQGVIVEAGDDAGVAARVAARLTAAGLRVRRVALPDTPASKTLGAVRRLADLFAEHGLGRDDLVIAVGGAAICDLAGFAAAIFDHGMRLCLVPTTLVAQADAAIGGKNAINLDRGRDLVGTIHQPVVVISDTAVACANSGRGFAAGLAEIAKHALISPSDLGQYLLGAPRPITAGDPDAVAAAVVRSVAIKADIVSRDEREHGDRLFLRYGYAFARAIERARAGADGDPGADPGRHPGADGGVDEGDDQGEALALGLMAAAYLARRQGRIGADVVDRHRRLIAGLGLPVRGELASPDLLRAWTSDERAVGGVRFVVLNGPGQPESGVTADRATLEGVLSDLAGPE